MALSTSTSTLAVGNSRTFNLSPGSALTLVAPPNVRATITETPNTVDASGVGGNASRVHNLQLPQTVTYGPYPMGGTVVVANASNSGGAVTWVRSDALVAESASGAVSLVSGDGTWRIGLRPSGDTTGATDVANMIAAIAMMPSTGGQLELEAGVFYLNAEVPINKTVDVVGAGGGIAGTGATSVSAGPTTINCLSATANGFRVTEHGCTFRNFALVNTSVSTPTAGAGILAERFNTGMIHRVTVVGFWNNLEIRGCYYHIESNNLYDAVNYSLYMLAPTDVISPSYGDHGDMVVANNIFSGWKKTYASAANLRYESGGGLKILGNKFNSGGQVGNLSAGVAAYCIDLMVADGVSTSSLVITGNSISGWATNTANIRIGQLGTTGKYINMVIVGNEITLGTRGLLFGPASSASDYIANLECSGNIFAYMSAPGITLFNCREVDIGRNNWRRCSSPFIYLGASPDTGSGVHAVRVAPQSIGSHDEVDIIQDDRTPANGIYQTGYGVEYDYTRGMYVTTNGSWQTACVLTIASGSAGIIEFDLDGINSNAANNSYARFGVAMRRVRSFDCAHTTGTITLATVGTDVSNGAGAANVAIQFVTAANTVTIQVQTTDATNLALRAGGRVQVDGKLTKFRIGA